MKNRYAHSREILTAIVHGIDPTSGAELPPDSVFQRADVIRAVLSAIGPLEFAEARATRRAQIPNGAGRAWAQDEEQQLLQEFAAGTTLVDMAETHGRTVRAIEARLEQIGVQSQDQHATATSPVGVGLGQQ